MVNSRKIFWLVLCVSVLAALALGACGTKGPGEATIKPRILDIALTSENTFEPSTFNLKLSEPVKFRIRNEASYTHTFIIRSRSMFYSLAAGESDNTLVFFPNQVTTLELVCRIHEDEGMVAQLIVE